MEEFELEGRVAAKVRGLISPTQTRAILPLPAVLGVVDVVLAKRMHTVIDTISATCSRSFLEASRKGRQILDITFPLTQVLEKGADEFGEAAVAQGDIKQFYDHIQPLKVAKWLSDNGLPWAESLTFLRLHSLPSIRLSVGQSFSKINDRTCGVLTGSRSAVAAGRVPVLDVALRRVHVWNQLAYRTDSRAFALAVFVDNLFSTGRDAWSATSIIDDAAVHLKQHWGLDLGQ